MKHFLRALIKRIPSTVPERQLLDVLCEAEEARDRESQAKQAREEAEWNRLWDEGKWDGRSILKRP